MEVACLPEARGSKLPLGIGAEVGNGVEVVGSRGDGGFAGWW